MTVKSTDCVPLKTWNQKRKGLPVSELSDSTKPHFLRPLPSSSTIVLCLTVCSSQDTFLSNSMTTLSLFLLQAFLHQCTSLKYTSRSQCPCTGTCWITLSANTQSCLPGPLAHSHSTAPSCREWLAPQGNVSPVVHTLHSVLHSHSPFPTALFQCFRL